MEKIPALAVHDRRNAMTWAHLFCLFALICGFFGASTIHIQVANAGLGAGKSTSANNTVSPDATSVLESSNADEIVKIARKNADKIMVAHGVSARQISDVIGWYRKAEAIQAESLTAEDAGRLGQLYLKLSESYADLAKRYLERSIAQTGSEEDRVALGNALLYLGDASAARREYLKVSEQRPEDAVLLINIAMAERLMGDTVSAYGRLRRVLGKSPALPVERTARLAVAQMQMASGDIAGAKAEVTKVLSRLPRDMDALRMLKDIYEKEGRKQMAEETARRLMSSGPPDGKAGPRNIKGERK